MPDRRPCRCGHKAYDHLGSGRCDEGTKRCGCPAFTECDHPETQPWRDRMVCTTCNQVLDGAA